MIPVRKINVKVQMVFHAITTGFLLKTVALLLEKK